ncbi:MAG: hypothetical protein IPK13_01460 [Deltaproteobacteria bacterium]|nr:hypothetical protein [Deltaproteobacteria bacterium]
MSNTITLVIVGTFSVVMSGIFHRFLRGRLPLSGAEYLFVGLAIGPLGADLLGNEVVTVVQPFVSLTLGFVGFHLGLGLRRRLAEAEALQAGFLSAVVVIAAVTAGAYGFFLTPIGSAWVQRNPLWISISIGCAAGAISARLTEEVILGLRARGTVTGLLRSFSLAANVSAVCIAGLGLAVSRVQQGSTRLGLTSVEWMVVSLSLGAASGLLFLMFVGRKADVAEDRLFLATVGIVVFTSGIAAAGGMSPLLQNALAGLLVSSLLKASDTLHEKLERLERPAMVSIMIFAGAMWRPLTGPIWILPVAYIVCRAIMIRLSSAVFVRAFPELPTVHRLGTGLLAQGGIAVAVALNHAQVNPLEHTLILGIVLTLLPLEDAMAPFFTRRVIVDAGEHARVAEDDAARPPDPDGGTEA